MKTYLIASLTAFFLSAAFTKLLLPVLRKLKAGQNILCYVKEHAKKAGTPTMGGLSFIAAAFVAACLFVGEPDGTFIVTLCLALAYAAVGFLDDYLKIRRKDNLGLKPYQKIIFQGAAAILAGIYCYRSGTVVCRLPFCGKSVNFRGFIVPFAAFVFVALVNAVNLTDGLDGLAGGSSAAYFFSFGVLIALQNAATGKAGAENSLALICFVLAASLCGFLLFNVFPASVFMGDTGSLALGGFAACVAVFSGNAFYAPVIGIMFVFSVITVVAQVIYYKATKGKRIFLMAPVHHHFQKKGYSECKISFAYAVITATAGLLSILFAL